MKAVKQAPVEALDEIAKRVSTALAALRSNQNMPLDRARAITACANILIDTVRVEIRQAAITQEKQ